MKDDVLEKIKADALKIITTKTEGVMMAKSIQDLIDNGLCDLMGCPAVYGLKEKDCGEYSCNSCWRYAIGADE